jgi:carbon storage regulator
MLIITRKVGEKVIVDENIEIVVVSIDGGKVRLGFNAPSSVRIHRQEVYERIQKANHDAAADKENVRLPSIPDNPEV